MRRALELAERGRGLTSPNPIVGAVVVRNGEIVGEGFHERAGAPHAEVVALAAAGPRARGATLYVTLEPCNHQGRTPPCVPAIFAAGITRVIAAAADPNPFVRGGGVEALRAAGVAVVTGLLASEAAAQNRAFFTAMRERRPYVTLKAGMTADGKIADVDGVARWITGETARAEAHRQRSESDAIVVGITTVLRDDPALTVRLGRPWPREPYRVVLDTTARTPVGARVITGATAARAIIAVGEGAPASRVAALEAAGATVLRCPSPDGRVDVGGVLAALFEREVRAVLLEGGGEVHAAFLDAGVVDRVTLFVAPMLLGGRAAPTVVGGAGRELKAAIRLGPLQARHAGEDLVIEADVLRPDGAS
ncbi:MAG TPA: bifunctional diaminohydroxyphosphoribosylaminopyrimidine deaminase/5-amino-6-(5-phosphoribosylamino)uracil reductase RibD [Methylomirabilota bacterium]|jgi:diaminohydroxyphosphoribosylaminopyrimidine deaminase/5-amino-6-(5-phosphoribosylamino)uracil reductase|nr:bifunctional diaminohydroxyphosphoribosylaminopyrimidine deaminase/5-amino-6-(5-phosphoribosylamino)uracil reductase RibD [Methylomirabilota bacterium]